jgi:hypothetical protein
MFWPEGQAIGNFKNQASTKSQTPTLKTQTFENLCLMLGAYLGFGA